MGEVHPVTDVLMMKSAGLFC